MSRTHFIICVDSSGSMSICKYGAEHALANQFKAIKEGAAKAGDETTVTLVSFGAVCGQVKTEWTKRDYLLPSWHTIYPTGDTPLFDAVRHAVDMPANYDAVVVYVVTDGFENASHCNRKLLLERMRFLIGTDRWTFAFQVPRGNKDVFVRDFGVPAGCVMEWETTDQGAVSASAQTQSSVATYYTARAAGKTAVKNFFVQPDLTNLRTTKLQDMTHRYKLVQVAKEEPIEDFVQRRTKRPYAPGVAFYQLMKKEKNVQDTKAILLVNKKTKTVLGGTAARTEIGLPASGTATVEPGNHADYDIFIQSFSRNRKLPRGTKVLLEV